MLYMHKSRVVFRYIHLKVLIEVALPNDLLIDNTVRYVYIE